MENPNYYGILPANVRYDKNLKPMEKILYVELTALSNKNGYCNAQNSYFAKLYEVHKNTAGSWINKLEKLGYVNSKLIYAKDKEGKATKQVIERRIYIINNPINEKTDTYQSKGCEPVNEKIDTPINEKTEEINNNTSNEYYKNNSSKEKINKKEKRKNEIEDFINSQDKSEEYKNLLFEFVKYRKKIKDNVKTPGPIKLLLKYFSDEVALKEALEYMDMYNWRTAEPQWIENKKQGGNNNGGKRAGYSGKNDKHSKKPDYTKGFDDWN